MLPAQSLRVASPPRVRRGSRIQPHVPCGGLSSLPLIPRSPCHSSDSESSNRHDANADPTALAHRRARLTPLEPPRWPIRMYIRVRLLNGCHPNAEGKVAFCDIRYDLAWDDGVRWTVIPLPLNDIHPNVTKFMHLAEVFTYTPACAQMDIPSDKLQVLRDLTRIFYLFGTEEEGFPSDLYNDVRAAIARHTHYQVSPPPQDRTCIIKAIITYVKRRVHEEHFTVKSYSAGELAVAEEVMFKERKVSHPIQLPEITLQQLRLRSEGVVLHRWSDKLHDFGMTPLGDLPPLSSAVEEEIRDVYDNMREH